MNEKGGLFIWDIETNLFYRKVNDDLGSKSPYNLHINNDCTFVIKDKDGYVVKSYGTAEKSVCFMYLQNNGDFVQFDEECLEKYRTFTALGGSHNRCYFGESIDKAVVNPTDEPSDPEFPIKLYEGQSVQAPFEMRSGNDVTIVRFEEDGNLIIFDNYEHREIKKQWIIPDRFRGQGPFTLSMEA